MVIDWTSKFAFTELHEKATTVVSREFLLHLIAAVPYKIHTMLTDNGLHFTDPRGTSWTAAEIKELIARKEPFRAHAFVSSDDRTKGRRHTRLANESLTAVVLTEAVWTGSWSQASASGTGI